ncbi:MAG: hypothetical protein ACE37H_09490 [Phycisphaeraceae bacterium]
MRSLSNIPEPTTATRKDAAEPAPQATVQTLGLCAKQPQGADPVGRRSSPSRADEEPQQQIDGVSCLLLLMIAGALLRLVLGFFGPMQGIDTRSFQALSRHGKQVFGDQPVDAFPLPGLLAAALDTAHAPGWVMVLVGSLLTLIAVPAAYVIGRIATGRRAAGVLAAALIAVHPGVLTAANTLSGTAIALGLVTLGLALSLHAVQRGLGFAIGGGILLALAGLTAPLLWIVAALAGPFVGHVSLKHGTKQAVTFAVVVSAFALVPIFGYRVFVNGLSADAALVEFTADPRFDGSDRSAGDRLLITLTDPSLAELGAALRLPLGDAGKLTANTIQLRPRQIAQPDPVADALADGWLLMNAGLAALAAVSVGVLLARRRYVETAVLAAPLLALAFVHAAPGEALRLPLIALIGVLAAGLLANKPVVEIDEQALTERAQRKAAKLAAKEAKEQARQQRALDKHKGGLYAFDQPTRREKKARHKQLQRQAETRQPPGILTEHITEESPAPARPI